MSLLKKLRMKKLCHRVRVLLMAVVVSTATAFSAGVLASNTYVGSITYSTTPENVGPGEAFTLTATFGIAGTGQPCTVSNIKASIQGSISVTGSPSGGRLVKGSAPRLTTTFPFSGFAAGDLTPSFTYTTTTQNGKTSCTGNPTPVPDQGKPPPAVKPTTAPKLGITKSLNGNTSDFVPGEVLSYKITVVNAGDATANGLT